MNFDWDDNKNKSNIEKHRISFEKAKDVFYDEEKIVFESEQESGELRFVILGEIIDILYSVIYTIRNTTIRIISARRANEKRTKYLLQQETIKKCKENKKNRLEKSLGISKSWENSRTGSNRIYGRKNTLVYCSRLK